MFEIIIIHSNMRRCATICHARPQGRLVIRPQVSRRFFSSSSVRPDGQRPTAAPVSYDTFPMSEVRKRIVVFDERKLDDPKVIQGILTDMHKKNIITLGVYLVPILGSIGALVAMPSFYTAVVALAAGVVLTPEVSQMAWKGEQIDSVLSASQRVHGDLLVKSTTKV